MPENQTRNKPSERISTQTTSSIHMASPISKQETETIKEVTESEENTYGSDNNVLAINLNRTEGSRN
jgi:hypothetical protein